MTERLHRSDPSPTPLSPESERGAPPKTLRQRVEELRALEARLRLGGGPEKIARQHQQGKLTARERIERLLDPGSDFLEIGLLVAYDQYEGEAPAAGVVTGIGLVHGRPIVIVANDATVKAGAWWPETIKKILRMQEIAMRNRVPIVYLVDSAGVNLPYQSGVFPGQYGAGRIFYYNSIMRRYLKVPQIAAVMGPCIAGGAYLPALSDVILMVEKTSFMGLGGPNLVKGATGQTVDSETLGGAWTHNALSGVAHYRTPNDEACLAKIRDLIALLPPPPPLRLPIREPRPPLHPPEQIYDILPADHRQAYDMYQILVRLFDDGEITEFQADYAREMICGYARIEGIPVGFLANQRGLIKNPKGGAPRLGGIIYTESAEKSAYFIETCNREGLPILFIQDVSGFMVGPEAEQSGIIRAGARMVEAMATATVPRLVLTINHASGAGYYAMAGQGFDPNFIFTWPTGRMGVMEGDTAIYAVLGPQLEKAKETGQMSDELRAAIERMHAEYEHTLDARFAAARGFVDAILAPEETRRALALALRVTLHNPGPHIGPFHIPTLE